MEHLTTTLRVNHILKGTAYTYHIENVLGQGSFGITYLASTSISVPGPLGNIETKIQVAIKEFFMKEFSSRHEDGTITEMTGGSLVQNYSKKFRKEAENLAKLSHPNIVNVLEVFDANNTCYYAMQYIPGGSLDEYVKKRGGLPEKEAIECIRQIGAAVQYMHDHRMLHLDLKPSNVMRSEDGNKMVLIDFGLSKQYEANGNPESSTSVGLGTAGYAPLEQSSADRDRDFAPTLDVYALGATFFKLLTGQTPPKGSDVLDEGLPLRLLNSKGVSTQSIRAIESAMEPRKSKRLPDVNSFLSMLSESSSGGEDETEIDNREHKPDLERHKSYQPKFRLSRNPGLAHTSKLFPKLIGLTVLLAAAIGLILLFIPNVGKISFDSEPQGAEVWLDGLYSGNITPCTMTNVPYGMHHISYKLNGYRGCDDSIQVSGRKQVCYSKSLSVAYGRLEVKGTPSDMEIFIDNVPIGKKTAKTAVVIDSVLVGTRNVGFKLKNYKDCRMEVEVKENMASLLTVKAEYDWPAPSGEINGHDFMDLGLSVKWATMNVGASDPGDYGSYFAWGETTTKNSYNWSNLKYCTDSTGDSFSKYNKNQAGTKDNKMRLEMSDDAARANWGGIWRMPTVDEWKELRNNCTWTWTSQGGHNGYKVTGKNGNSIFLPAAGCRFGESLNLAGETGYYWSSSLDADGSYSAFGYSFYSGDVIPSNWGYRCNGRSVRPVCSSL